MIGKAIQALLTASADLLALVPEASIFPYVLNENTSLPAIVYTIDEIETEYTKDGWVQDEYIFSVVTLSKNYEILQNIIQEVREALELKSGEYGGVTLQKIYLDKFSEGFNITEDVFMNRLTFSVII